MLPALIIFLLTYLLMLVLPQYRPFAALGGAALFLALGAAGLWDFTLMDAARAVDFNVLLMMAGTMGTVSLFIESRMPARLAELLIVRVPNVKWAVCMLALFAGVISAFVDNVATVLMVAPVGLAIARKLRISPVPVLISIAVSSNLQGAATLVGDTTSILLGGFAEMNFFHFFWMEGRPGIFFGVELGALASLGVLLFTFRHETQPISAAVETELTDTVPSALMLLTVDRFNNVLVTQTLSVGMEKLKPVLFPLLAKVLRADGQTIDGIYERNDEALRAKEGLEQNKGWFALPGESHPNTTQTEICENGVYYHVDFENGQKTGFFLDQKYNRRAVARLAAGHTVLDCFTHTGSFALNAAKGGAARVTAADISAEAIAMAKRNADRNGLDNMDFLCEDTFALLPRLEKEGSPYDFIILDPPAFTKARRTVENAMRGYKEINYRAMKLLPRGGYLATASCSHFATEELFIKMLRAAAKDAHRQLRQIEVKQQAPDHPILWGVPETNYLKFFLFQVI